MTGHDRQSDPRPSWSEASSSPRTHDLEVWIDEHASRYARSALQSWARAAGYTEEEVSRAFDAVETRRPLNEALGPIRARARWLVLGSYAIVWVLFAVPYLTQEMHFNYGPLAQAILSVALVAGLVLCWVWIRRARTHPADLTRALAVMLSVPLVILIGVAGLCVPFLPR